MKKPCRSKKLRQNKSGASLNFIVGVPSSPKVVHANQIPGMPEYSPTREQVGAVTFQNTSTKNKPVGRVLKSEKLKKTMPNSRGNLVKIVQCVSV